MPGTRAGIIAAAAKVHPYLVLLALFAAGLRRVSFLFVGQTILRIPLGFGVRKMFRMAGFLARLGCIGAIFGALVGNRLLHAFFFTGFALSLRYGGSSQKDRRRADEQA